MGPYGSENVKMLLLQIDSKSYSYKSKTFQASPDLNFPPNEEVEEEESVYYSDLLHQYKHNNNIQN